MPDEEALFWFGLADTQWNHGRLLPFVKEKALYWLDRDDDKEVWREESEKQLAAWERTREKLREKLNSEQPPEKKVYKYRQYKCDWELGGVYACQFKSDFSKEQGFYGKYYGFRKVSERTCWPNNFLPFIKVYLWVWEAIPTIEEVKKRAENSTPITLDRLLTRDHMNKEVTYIGSIVDKDVQPNQGIWGNSCIAPYTIEEYVISILAKRVLKGGLEL